MEFQFVDYDGQTIKTYQGDVVYFEDWLREMGYKTRDAIICDADDPEEELDSLEAEFDEWCDAYGVYGEMC